MGDKKDMDLSGIRRDYSLNTLDESRLPRNPLELFSLWMKDARSSGNPMPTAMTLSTVGRNGQPSSRTVLLKKVEEERLIFFTNYHSKKSSEIRVHNRVAAHFFWPELERQIKISGIARPAEVEDSDTYFSSRPLESNISAWASPQSEIIPDRAYLENEYRKYYEKFRESKKVPRPAFWGGYAIRLLRIEFWQGRPGRLHDRIEYSRREKHWEWVRLAP